MGFLIVIALIACKRSEPEAPPAPPPPPIDLCSTGVRALDHVTCSSPTAPDIQKAKESFVGLVDAFAKAGDKGSKQFQIMCAQLLVALDRDLGKAGCKLELEASDRAMVKGMIDAYYAERTPVTPTGDAASDAVIKRAATIRDAMCACADMTCLERVDAQLESIGSLPASAPQTAKDLGAKLLDDVGRCEARIRNAAGL